MRSRYTIAAFDDATPSDMAHDLAAMVDYLIEAETENSRHYGLILFHKIIRDNLSALAERVRDLSEQKGIPVEAVKEDEFVADLEQRLYCDNDVTQDS
jgi:hypothetical protein